MKRQVTWDELPGEGRDEDEEEEVATMGTSKRTTTRKNKKWEHLQEEGKGAGADYSECWGVQETTAAAELELDLGAISTSPASSGTVMNSSAGPTCRESVSGQSGSTITRMFAARHGAPPPARLRRALDPTASSPLSWCVVRICLTGSARMME